MRRYTIAIADGGINPAPALPEAVSAKVTIITGPVTQPAQIRDLTAEADALVVTLHPIRGDHLQSIDPRTRVIGRAGVGLDSIDVSAATARGLAVIYEPDYASSEVADHAAGMILALARGLFPLDAALRRKGWAAVDDAFTPLPLNEMTLGVLGCGRIGMKVVERMRPFLGKIIGYDPHLVGPPPRGVEMVSDLTDLLTRVDVVTVHMPLTSSTRGLIGAFELSCLPQHALVVNVSRGGLIDELALADRLHVGKLGGAALDVFEIEPLTLSSPLRDIPNVILTPHVAWASRSSGQRLAAWVIEDIVTFLTTGDLRHGSVAMAG